MKVYDAASIRNVALVGHTGSGKTQLTSAILPIAGMVNRFGKVDDGTTVTDFDDEEIARKHTLSASLAYAEWNKHKINLIDTPGMGNFLSDARAALQVADAALIVVDAVSGVMVQTEKVWEAAQELELPRLVVLNRLDRERASLERSLQSLREACSRTVIPIQLPIGEEKIVSRRRRSDHPQGVRLSDRRERQIHGRRGAGRHAPARSRPRARRSSRWSRRPTRQLMERFFEAGTLTDEELVSGLRMATVGGKAVSARLHIGDRQHRHAAAAGRDRRACCRRRPIVRSRALAKDGSEVERTADDKAPDRGVRLEDDCRSVRRTHHDVSRGFGHAQVRFHRLQQDEGRCRSASAALQLLQGKTPTAVPEIKAGDLGSVAKLKDTLTGDTLGDKADPIVFPPLKFPEPVLAYAIEPKTRGDEDKISTSMHRIEEEDPSIHYSRDPQTKELLLAGQGQLHIEVTVAKLKRRFGVDVNLKPPRIPYRETIKAATEAHGRHKKQTGGHGQFGDCKIRVEPLARGADFEFVDDIFGGSIPRQFVPAVEKGIQDARTRGYLAGYPMVDFRVTVFDGSYHDVDSNELSFKLAGSLAFKDAMTRARPTILEPVMNVEVYAPSDYAGDLMGDLNGRRGRIGGMDTRGAMTIIKAQVPMSEMLTYEQHLTSATGGRGSYHMEYSHYDEVPAHQQTKIIAAAKAARTGEEVEEA